jgi:hypothetical protein
MSQLIRLQAEKAFILNELAGARNDYKSLEEEYLRVREAARERPAAPANPRPPPEPTLSEPDRCGSAASASAAFKFAVRHLPRVCHAPPDPVALSVSAAEHLARFYLPQAAQSGI